MTKVALLRVVLVSLALAAGLAGAQPVVEMARPPTGLISPREFVVPPGQLQLAYPDLVVYWMGLFPRTQPNGEVYLGVLVMVRNAGTRAAGESRTALIKTNCPAPGVIAVLPTPALEPGDVAAVVFELPFREACTLNAYVDWPTTGALCGVVDEYGGPPPTTAPLPPGECNNRFGTGYSGDPLAP